MFVALAQGLGVVQERFASPLSYNANNDWYWSMYEADMVFGAKHDAFSEPWTGISHANPVYAHDSMDKSVRYAIGSALASQGVPTAIIFRTHFKFKSPDHWQGHRIYGANPKWDMEAIRPGVTLAYSSTGLRARLTPAARSP